MTKQEAQKLMDTMRRFYPFAKQLRSGEAVTDYYQAMRHVDFKKAEKALWEYAAESVYPPPVYELLRRSGGAKKKKKRCGTDWAEEEPDKNGWMKEYTRKEGR
ncbi:MAG: hypothetical protein GXW99_08180 [Clostridiales bacterium]|nr:hypothetical protein [Clostridiales bacterium]